MRGWRLHRPGGPDAFVLEDMPRPVPTDREVLIEVRAFGLNRSEWFTRIGQSPTVSLPRVLGIECAGTVVAAPGGEFSPGQKVCAMMGGMGRQFDGSYAEFTCVPVSSVFPVHTELPWEILGALPEMLQTCHGSLHVGLAIRPGQTLLIRGGTSSIGLAALAMAASAGLSVISTSRSAAKVGLLEDAGAIAVIVDDGAIAASVRAAHPAGVDGVLELVGASTLLDSLQCVRPGATVCMTGILGGEWKLASFRPMGHIPSGVRLTSYSGDTTDITRDELQQYISLVETNRLSIHRGPVWNFDQLPLAHQAMDENRANGKMVVLHF